MTWTTKQARAWVAQNAAALIQIALDEDHAWLRAGPDGEPVNEFSRRRVERAARLFVERNSKKEIRHEEHQQSSVRPSAR